MIKLISESNKARFSIYDLANFDEIRDEFIEMLISFAKEARPYQTDVYLYVDESTNTGELYEFTNVGGNSWLDDDHYVLYIDRQHNENVFNWYNDIDELAYAIGISEEQLIAETADFVELDIDDVDYNDVTYYIENNDEYLDAVNSAYCEAVEDMRPEYTSQADEIIAEFDKPY
jgi:hypothetical protein